MYSAEELREKVPCTYKRIMVPHRHGERMWKMYARTQSIYADKNIEWFKFWRKMARIIPETDSGQWGVSVSESYMYVERKCGTEDSNITKN